MIVWGGWCGGSCVLNDGGVYDPAADTWTPVSMVGAPTGRRDHTAAWTGSEMIIWGGDGGTVPLVGNMGARYDPIADTWAPVSTLPGSVAMVGMSNVWSGSDMIVWGGGTNHLPPWFNTGGVYSPATDTWLDVSTLGAPAARISPSGVWTDSEMIIWGGVASSVTNTGGRYVP